MLTIYVGTSKPKGWQFVDSTFVNDTDYEICQRPAAKAAGLSLERPSQLW